MSGKEKMALNNGVSRIELGVLGGLVTLNIALTSWLASALTGTSMILAITSILLNAGLLVMIAISMYKNNDSGIFSERWIGWMAVIAMIFSFISMAIVFKDVTDTTSLTDSAASTKVRLSMALLVTTAILFSIAAVYKGKDVGVEVFDKRDEKDERSRIKGNVNDRYRDGSR